MDYKEKYEEAYEKVAARFGSNVANEIFPEFTESEDERIRKEIIDLVRHSVNCMPADKFNERIDWLEKQEHAITCSEEQMKVLNEVLNFAANHENPYWNYYIFGTLNNLIRQLKN